jgi:hypothetical protein
MAMINVTGTKKADKLGQGQARKPEPGVALLMVTKCEELGGDSPSVMATFEVLQHVDPDCVGRTFREYYTLDSSKDWIDRTLDFAYGLAILDPVEYAQNQQLGIDQNIPFDSEAKNKMLWTTIGERKATNGNVYAKCGSDFVAYTDEVASAEYEKAVKEANDTANAKAAAQGRATRSQTANDDETPF